MNNAAKIRFLLQPETLVLLDQLMLDRRDDLALAQSPLLRSLPVGERAALLEQRALRQRGALKQRLAHCMVWTPLGLMQMTSEALAEAKVNRFAKAGVASLGDLCCGLGGDSLKMPKTIQVVGIDRDEATLLAYRHNVGLVRTAMAVLGDANDMPAHFDACIIDPARRPKGSRENWGDSEMMPSLAQLMDIRSKQPHLAIKLGPGLSLPEAFHDAESEYLGWKDACLELMVWCGSLGEQDTVRATEWPSGASITALRRDRDESFLDLGDNCEENPSGYLYEPVKCVVRAHLHAVLAQSQGLRLLDPRIAYLTGTQSVAHPLLKRYAIKRELSADLGRIKAVFRDEDIGEVTVKKRGVALIPEKVRAEVVKRGGKNRATLIFTRIGEKRRAFWVEPEFSEDSVCDGEGSLADDE